MTTSQRRDAVLQLLRSASGPVSAASMAGQFGVSRQIIVGDIALLRACGTDILATPRGYLLGSAADEGVRRTVACVHSAADMQAELNLMVDNGCTVVDVVVEHSVYGQLTGALHLSSRYDVSEFIQKVKDSDAKPLSDLTGGIHLHTLLCPSQAAFARTREALAQAGCLYQD